MLKMCDLDTGLLIVTFHRIAPTRCCAFIDRWRLVAGDEGSRIYVLTVEEFGAVEHQ